jgi:hypothetical protein
MSGFPDLSTAGHVLLDYNEAPVLQSHRTPAEELHLTSKINS